MDGCSKEKSGLAGGGGIIKDGTRAIIEVFVNF